MIIDLTHTLDNNITVYPGTEEPCFKVSNTIEKDGFTELSISMCSHTGTHMDAPAHIIQGAKSLDMFPIEKFIGAGVVLDCSKETLISLDFLKSYEEEISKAEFILLYTGWAEKWSSKQYFNPFPTMTLDAAKWLSNFNLKGIGVDAISIDPVDDESLPNHHIFLPKEIVIIENLCNLDRLINKEFEFNCIPLNIARADGSPIRAFARIK